MSLREKVRRVFQRHKSKESDTGIKIVYYRRSEIPPSKFKGPFDKEHQRRLAAWSFREAQADRPRSLDLSLSPCTTLPDYLIPREVAEAAPAQVQPAEPRIPGMVLPDEAAPATYHDEFIHDRQGIPGSLSSTTAVDPESFSDSTMTLFLDPLEDEAVIKVKEPPPTTSPIVRTISPRPMSPKRATSSFAPEDRMRALTAVQIYS